MTLRMEWRETVEWLHMEARMFYFHEPLKFPEGEFEVFVPAWLLRMGSLVRTTTHTPIANNPNAKFLWWCWLRLDPEQKEILQASDTMGVIEHMAREFECFPTLLADMQDQRKIYDYWNSNQYVTTIYKLTPKCITRLDKETYLEVFFQYQSDLRYPRIKNLAIQYHENLEDVLAYVGPTYTVISHTDARLVLKTPNGNAQILKDQWLWFNGLEFCHGDLKRLKQVQLGYLDPRDAPGIWIKPT
ncbi:hypothetical protein ST201phi2-1p356 [Pseudomonas phage 201phi2-1]|uniref:Uncharacterized protein n=1 Tax=Pseudomonas phage 201phi2-1 TaxID=198110 RepID=B3FJL7_BP201|nr:hypothetical protein ST201phi2-1p356 [Pseudomonas phage 201phi2-1]ABY63182.1 hypothetical protein 201phi2-1p356 [Pseudomonas phage 201phi2-1]